MQEDSNRKTDKNFVAKKRKVVQKDILHFDVFCITINRKGYDGLAFVPIKTFITEELL